MSKLLRGTLMNLLPEDYSFLQSMGVKQEDFKKSELSIDTLKKIADDYKSNELILLDEAEYIAKKIQRCEAVHSVRWRIKSVSHLIKKIVRKLSDDQKPAEKYKGITVDNYKTIVTDLIGVRAIYLFKSDWEKVHKHILSRWVLKEHEPVTIYHRKGDIMDIYDAYIDCKQEIHFYNYRSIHYLVPATKINSEQIYCEIQTRTIFEEGWSEIDHKVRYPDYSEDANLMSYLTIFNRLAGSADEMGSYVNELVALIKQNNDLEDEREQRETQFLIEKEKLHSDIQKLSGNGKNIEQVKVAYEQLIDVQKQEIESLKLELKSQTNENVRLNRTDKTPMVLLKNQTIEINNNTQKGELEIQVNRTNSFATFTGQLNLEGEGKRHIDINMVDVKGTSVVEDMRINTGISKDGKTFNVHLFNDVVGHVEIGSYKFKYEVSIQG